MVGVSEANGAGNCLLSDAPLHVLLGPGFPIARSLALVHHGEDLDLPPACSIDHGEREAIKKNLPQIVSVW